MDKETFTKYVNDISLLNSDTLPEIKGMLEEYPYFQSAWILYIKNLHAIKDIRYESKLKTASAYVSDKKVLFEIVKGIYTPKPLEESVMDPEINEQAEQPAAEEIIEEALPTETETTEDIVEEVASETPQPTIENEPAEEVTKNPQEVAEPIVASEERETTLQEEEQKIKAAIETQLLALGFKPTITFSDGKASVTFEKIEETHTEEKKVDEGTQNNEPKHTPLSKDKKKNLIDDFLKSEAKIVPIKNYHSDSTLSTDSLIEDEELFSEKLAKIYIKQGLYEKALATYEKLYLKYPEKYIYFATQIEYVKRLINK